MCEHLIAKRKRKQQQKKYNPLGNLIGRNRLIWELRVNKLKKWKYNSWRVSNSYIWLIDEDIFVGMDLFFFSLFILRVLRNHFFLCFIVLLVEDTQQADINLYIIGCGFSLCICEWVEKVPISGKYAARYSSVIGSKERERGTVKNTQKWNTIAYAHTFHFVYCS